MQKCVGILAVQGGFQEHVKLLARRGVASRLVRSLKDVDGLTGFILPGGESTVMDLFMRHYNLKSWLIERVREDASFVVMGTCAGLILLARYGLLDCDVQRNAYGRQLDSFQATLQVKTMDTVDTTFELRGHFIRAPKVLRLGAGVQILAQHETVPVLIRQGSVWGLSFHPELADDERLHSVVFS